MTLAPPERSGARADSAGFGSDTDGVPVRRVVRRRERQRRKRRRRLLILQGGATVAFTALLVSMVWIGWSSTMRITGGRIDAVTDPSAPGYVAPVKPTSVTLIAFTMPPSPTLDDLAEEPDADDDLAEEPGSDSVDGLGAEDAGAELPEDPRPRDEDGNLVELASMLMVIEGTNSTSVVPISANLALWTFEDAPVASARDIFDSGGADVLRLRLGADATFGSTSTLTVPLSTVVELAEQVGPVSIELPDDVLQLGPGFTAEVRYPAGELTLESGEVGEFLSFAGLNEPESNRLLRSELLWDALFVGGAELPSGPQLVGGDDVEEFQDLLANLVDGEVELDSMPIQSLPIPAEPSVVLNRIDPEVISGWVVTHVSFPVSAYPGQRARVRLLNGTTDPDAPAAVAPTIVSAGGEVVQTGNAEAFDLDTSRVEYASPEAQAAAERIAAAFGLTAQANPELVSDSDVDVVVGSDRAAG